MKQPFKSSIDVFVQVIFGLSFHNYIMLDIKKVKWFQLEALPENLTETVRQVLNAYRKGVFYSEM